MTATKMLVLPAIILTMVAGCKVYTRPNTTEAEYNQDRYQCQQEAVKMFPALMTERVLYPGRQNPANTNCTTNNGYTSCTTTGGGYTPPTTTIEDGNQTNRINAEKSCMSARGYGTKWVNPLDKKPTP
jgi:hypothetical protein